MKRHAILLALTLASCAAEDVRGVLERRGFSDIRTEANGSALNRDCGIDDNAAFRFSANDRQGRRVSGTACVGNISGITVKLDR